MGKYEAFTDAARSVDVHRFVRMQARDAQLVVGDELKHRDCSRAIGTRHAIDSGSCNFKALGSQGLSGNADGASGPITRQNRAGSHTPSRNPQKRTDDFS